ncbi:MAG: pimeloyl-ACP methyl ester carboxylesterase [Bermanella sp.]
MDINWHFFDASITIPVCSIAGEQDPIMLMSGGGAMDFMRERVPDLRKCVIVPKAGHWVQREQAKQVNEVMLRFLREL